MHFKFLIITCFLFLCSEISFAQLYEVSEPIKLSESINTPAEESNPWILQNRNSKELYFVRTFDEEIQEVKTIKIFGFLLYNGMALGP
ncbi:MAG: hypothetical protein ACK5AY_01375 [Bacteroidota bacterium]